MIEHLPDSEEPLVRPTSLEVAVALAPAFQDLVTEETFRDVSDPFTRFHSQLVGLVQDAAINSEHSLQDLSQACAAQVSGGSWSVDLMIIDSFAPYSISVPGYFRGVRSAVEWVESLLPTNPLLGSLQLLQLLEESGRNPVHPASTLSGFILLHEHPHSILPRMELRQSSMHLSPS